MVPDRAHLEWQTVTWKMIGDDFGFVPKGKRTETIPLNQVLRVREWADNRRLQDLMCKCYEPESPAKVTKNGKKYRGGVLHCENNRYCVIDSRTGEIQFFLIPDESYSVRLKDGWQTL